ncbi:MAG: FprA family A-type flavoprotein [Bacteroidales bacterium]
MAVQDDRVISITDDVKWIGVLDRDIVTFDIVMNTEFGTTYNSYFINATDKAIVEAAKDKFSDVHISKLKSVTDPSEIKYIILDHTEPDHCGNTGKLLELAPDATVVGSGNAIRYLSDIINKPFKSLIVKDGDTLSLGNKTLRFISAPNLHWPDTMFTWLEEDRILFTCDVFGAHYCFDDIFSDFTDEYLKSFKYYFDVILKPYSRFAVRAIEKISGLPVKYICTGHGPCHSDNLEEVISLTNDYAMKYLRQTAVREKKNVLVTYISAYGYTRRMAEEIAEGLKEHPRINVILRDIESMPLGEMESDLVAADALLVGSPTINQNTLLPVYRLFSVINPLRDNSKLAGSFGSFGWSGEAPRIISEVLRSLKMRVFADNATVKFYPGEEKSTELREYGRRFADYLITECGEK